MAPSKPIIYLETDNLSIGVNKNGWHAAEGFILARYQMFTQVYFQHTRRAYDNHILEAMKLLLQSEYGQDTFLPPTEEKNGEKYIKPLSQYSNIIANLVPNNQIRIYVPIENKRNIKNKINNIREDLQNDKRI